MTDNQNAVAELGGSYGIKNIFQKTPEPRNFAKIPAVHINSTAPFFHKYPGGIYEVEAFEILTGILSALCWQKYNGDILMITDHEGARYLYENGLDCFWNGIEVKIDGSLEGINPRIYWAAGKLLGLRAVTAPCTLIDMDFIAWRSIGDILRNKKIVTAHNEPIDDCAYPSREFFEMKPGYKFDEQWSWTANPVNTAFVHINDNEFRSYYCSKSIEFMKNATNAHNDGFRCMVFAEQRLISMCAEKYGYSIETLIDDDKIFDENTPYTHTWCCKKTLRAEQDKQKIFSFAVLKKILELRPDAKSVLKRIAAIKPLFEEMTEENCHE